MDIAASRTSVGTDDYSLIKHEKCNPPRAKLCLVFVISLVVATLIVLLVVLTRLDSPADVTHDDTDHCSDIAIVGAGLAGSYAAWLLRRSNKSIVMYEMADEVGGRFQSEQYANVTFDLGASFFLPDLHPLMKGLVSALGLETKKRDDMVQMEEDRVYFLRGHNFTIEDILNGYNPYKLGQDERGYTPLQLLRKVLQTDEILSANAYGFTRTVDSWMNLLHSESIREVILERASYAAYQYLQDALYWWEYNPHSNARASLDYVTAMASDEKLTIEGGMDRIIDELISQTILTNKRFRVELDSEILSVEAQESHSRLQLNALEASDGKNLAPCAKSVILAVPPTALSRIVITPHDVEAIWRANLEHLAPVAMIRVIAEFTSQGAPQWLPRWGGVRTELPIDDVTLISSTCFDVEVTNDTDAVNASDNLDTECTMHYEITIYDRHVTYWVSLLTEDGLLASFTNSMFNITDMTSSKFVSRLTRYLADIPGHPDDVIPSYIAVKLWDGDNSPEALSTWKPEVNWTSAGDSFMWPIADVGVHMVGADYAPSYLQVWAEGALYSVETLMKRLFS